MKNREFYKDDIIGSCSHGSYNSFCNKFVKNKILKRYELECNEKCVKCLMLQFLWLEEEYEEPKEDEVDWSKVEVDTKVLVSKDGCAWYKRYFAKYENGSIFVFDGGCTSFTTQYMTPYKNVKLYKEGEE